MKLKIVIKGHHKDIIETLDDIVQIRYISPMNISFDLTWEVYDFHQKPFNLPLHYEEYQFINNNGKTIQVKGSELKYVVIDD